MKAETFKDWLPHHSFWPLLGVESWTEWYSVRHYHSYGFLPELWYYLKCRYWFKYNTVTVKTLQPTWIDRDELLLHASFAILCAVVDDEKLFARTEYQGGWMAGLQEVAQLYDWWTVRRPQRDEQSRFLVTIERLASPKWDESHQFLRLLGQADQMHTYNADEDTAMLKRLADIRGYLWT